jgi:ankyrin repeat protein
LHACAHNGSARVARLLIERGASIDIRERKYQATPLGHAVWAGRTEMVELLSQVSRDVFSLAKAGKLDRLRILLDEDPSLVRATHDGRKLLHFLSAPEERAIDIAELLLACGADAQFKDKEGKTAAALAAQQGLEDLAELLRGPGSPG